VTCGGDPIMIDPKDLRTYQIFQELEKNQTPSQRDLARKLNVSLGLVNSFMKKLVLKGYFKITNIPKNRVKYILTPTGAAEKTRLTYKYIQHSFDFYKSARSQLHTLLQHLSDQNIERVVFWGTGTMAEIAYITLQETPIQLVAVVDNKNIGNKFLNFSIVGINQLQSLIYDKIIVTPKKYTKEIAAELIQKGISPEKLIILGENIGSRPS
jgi:DNA-binding MarR family transcriptional regulator